MDACRMIKHLVPDADVKKKQIECWMSYKPGTAKLAETKTETKVVIFAKLKNNKGMLRDDCNGNDNYVMMYCINLPRV